MTFRIYCLCFFWFFIQQSFGELESKKIYALGLKARVYPEKRDAYVQQIANKLSRETKQISRRSISEYQEALLLVCDTEILKLLSTETIESVDEALEKLFSVDDLRDQNRWDRLAYVYGFFNHDVTAEEIETICNGWREMPEDQKKRLYPSYIHCIDAVCKPLAFYNLKTNEETSKALRIALPILKDFLTQPALPGRAFHAPSHAVLILTPLYERLDRDPAFQKILYQNFGNRDEFEKLIANQLIGSLDREFSQVDFNYYFYTGQYHANALARLNARSTISVLKNSLRIYQLNNTRGSVIKNTKRALIALGDADQRSDFEKKIDIRTLVWLCRNGQGETVEYATDLLAKNLDCSKDESLLKYYRQILTKLSAP